MDAVHRPSVSQGVADTAFAAAVVAVAVGVHVSGAEAVAANRPVGMLSIALTVLATAPLAVRRRWPVGVLVATSCAALAMALTRSTVGMATIGPLVAFYTATAYAARGRLRSVGGVVLIVLGLTALVQPVDLSTEGAVVNLVCLGFAGILGLGVRERRERHETDLAAAEHRAELERALAEQERQRADAIAVEERLRLTRELHDVIGHALSVMVVQAGVAERLLQTRPDQARLAVSRIAGTGRDSLAEMRRLLEVMRVGDSSPVASRHPAPTLHDVDALVDEVRAAGFEVGLVRTGSWDRVPAGQQLAAYRIVQEALTNCLKHSDGTRATVRIALRDDLVEIDVLDDGRPTPAGRPGHGITGMRERVAFYGGCLEAGPRNPDGFGVHAELPVAREPLQGPLVERSAP